MTHDLVKLARAAIAHYLESGTYLEVEKRPGDGPPVGLFVSLHDRPRQGEPEGRLRGCRGSVRPWGQTLYAEVVRQAVNAAVDDPRCVSVGPEEVDELDITVYLLSPYEEVDSLEDLDPARYGVIVESKAGQRALLLPAIPGIETAAEQVHFARRKALIADHEPATIYRFEAQVLR